LSTQQKPVEDLGMVFSQGNEIFHTTKIKYSKLVFFLCIAALHHFDHDHKENPIPISPAKVKKKKLKAESSLTWLHFLGFGFFGGGFSYFSLLYESSSLPKKKN
jgi:hypothetical protein